jgi:hypothetical protein
VSHSTWYIDDSELGTFDLNGFENVYVLTFDPGAPDHRENIDPLAGQSGEADLTAYHSGRIVSASLRIAGSFDERHYAWRRLTGYTRPDLRPTIHWERPGVGPRQITGRCKLQGSIQPGGRALVPLLTMRAALGVWLDDDEQTTTVHPGSIVSAGRIYSTTYPRTYPAGGGFAGEGSLAYSSGTTFAPPIIRIYGPGVDPDIEIDSPSGAAYGRWAFDGVTLLASDYLEIDVAAGTVLLNGSLASPRYDKLDFALLRWGLIVPGNNTISLAFASGTDTNSSAIVTWHDADL